MVELFEGLKIPWPVMAVRVQVPLRVQDIILKPLQITILQGLFSFFMT